MDNTPEPRTKERSSRETHDALMQDLQAMLEHIRPLLRPVLAADLQERAWQHVERLQSLAAVDRPTAPPLVARPRSVPAPLNPFFFQRRP